MFPSPEFLLLQQSILIGTTEQAQRNAQQLLKEHVIDWAAFLGLVAYHSIQPQVAGLFHTLPEGFVPATTRERLKVANKAVAIRQLANVREFLHIHALLKAKGITAVPYKGFWLAHSAYHSVTDRESSDVDLYILAEDLGEVQKIMFARGYVPETGSPDDDAQLILRHNGEYNFDQFEAGKRLYHIEFHASASSQKLGLDIGLADLRDQINLQIFQGQIIPTFSPSALLFLTVLHHGGKDAWSNLKQVLDMGRLLQRYPDQLDWQWLRQINQRCDTERLLWVGLGLAQTLTGLSVPEFLQPELDQAKVKGLIHNRLQRLMKSHISTENPYRAYARRLWFLLNSQRYWKTRWILMLNHLKPSPVFDQSNRREGLQRWLLVRVLSRLRALVWNTLSR